MLADIPLVDAASRPTRGGHRYSHGRTLRQGTRRSMIPARDAHKRQQYRSLAAAGRLMLLALQLPMEPAKLERFPDLVKPEVAGIAKQSGLDLDAGFLVPPRPAQALDELAKHIRVGWLQCDGTAEECYSL